MTFESHQYVQCAQINRVEEQKECVFYNFVPQMPYGEVSVNIHKWGMENMCTYTHSHILEMHLDDNETTNSNIGNNESF